MTFPRVVKDRVVQHPSRYTLVLVPGTTDTYDLVPVPGAVTEVGTAINKAYLQPIENLLPTLATQAFVEANVPDLTTIAFSRAGGTVSPMSSWRTLMSSAVVGNELFLFGGRQTYTTSTYLTDVTMYNLTAGTWTARLAYPITIAQSGAVGAENGLAYIFGGRNTSVLNQARSYDPVSNTYTTLANISSTRYDIRAVAKGDFIYLMGGHTGGDTVTTHQRYNILLNTYTGMASLPGARHSGAVGMLDNDTVIYASGEWLGYGARGDTWTYSILANAWTTVAAMNLGWSRIYAIGAFILGGFRIYGGTSNGNSDGGDILNVIEYSRESNSWKILYDLPVARTRSGGGDVKGAVVLAGSHSNQNEPINTTIVYQTYATIGAAQKRGYAGLHNSPFWAKGLINLTTGKRGATVAVNVGDEIAVEFDALMALSGNITILGG